MKFRVVTILIAVLLLAGPFLPAAEAVDCLVVQSSALRPYEEARLGFAAGWAAGRSTRGPKSVAAGEFAFLVLDEKRQLDESDALSIATAEVVVAIGSKAFTLARSLRRGPIVFLLVPEPGKANESVTGVEMQIPPAQQLAAISAALPGLRSLGALYHPQHRGLLVEKFADAALKKGRPLILNKIDSQRPSDLPIALAQLADRIDGYLLLPCPLLATPQALQAIQNFAALNRLPILGFSERHLALGAGLVLTFDTTDQGAQAARLAGRILDGVAVAGLPVESPRKIRVIANRKILDKMGVRLKETAIDTFYQGGGTAP